LEEFAAAREQFSYWVNRLQSEEMDRMEHGEVEATIAQEGNELLRRRPTELAARTELPLEKVVTRYGGALSFSPGMICRF
jgi:hypothetical protein